MSFHEYANASSLQFVLVGSALNKLARLETL
eukprot:SAG25_NODE_14285_length_256_cov_3.331210_1_plen_30_part_10